jgi:hypothetical protein
LQCLRAKGRRQ